jgi:hypothetical protein
MLTKSVSDIIIFALNDGGADNDHDDFIGAAIVTERADCECAPSTSNYSNSGRTAAVWQRAWWWAFAAQMAQAPECQGE